MDPKIDEMLARLAELTPDELAELDTLLTAEFDKLDEGDATTPEVVEQMKTIADNITLVRTTAAEQAEAQAQADATAAALREQIHAVADDGDGAADPEIEGADGVEAPTDEVDEGDEAEEGAEGTPQAVAASGRPAVPPRPSLSAMSSKRSAAVRRGPSTKNEDRDPARGSAKVYAQRTWASQQNGDEVSTWDRLIDGVNEAVQRLGKGTGEDVLVASVHTAYPEDRRLSGDVTADTKKIDAVVDQFAARASLVASGGICNPVNVDYTIPVFADDAEPLKDALPKFQADRGGLRFVQPPTLASVGAAGTALWTQAIDAGSPGNSATKPVQTFTCGNEVEVYVDAISTRLRFGNMMARFSPEIVEANTRLALANAARLREEHRLTQIAGYSTLVSSGQILGAARDFLATLDLICEAYRYRQRLPRSTQLRVVLPEYLRGLIRADLVRELAHDNDTGTSFVLSDAQFDAMLAVRNVSPIWVMDDVPVPGSGAIQWPFQGFGAQSTQSALVGWPTSVSWFVFAEGTFQFLDGGQLNLGVVRDSALDAMNNYETFVEVFETIAKRGVESLQVISKLVPNGASARGIQTATEPALVTVW